MNAKEATVEALRALDYFAVCDGHRTMETKALKSLLLQTNGIIFRRGVMCAIRCKNLGAGVQDVWTEPHEVPAALKSSDAKGNQSQK